MEITGIETILLGDDFPPDQIQRWNGGAIHGWTEAFVRIRAKGGLWGLGEAYFGGFVPQMIPPAVEDLGKLLIISGVVLIAAGILLVLLSQMHFPLGRLPGDIVYRGKRTTFYLPLATSILLSVVLSLVLYVLGKWKR